MGGFLSGLSEGYSGSGAIGGLAKKAGKWMKSRRGKSADKDPSPPSFHKGGTVRKTGLARLKKGEKVLTKGQQEQIRKRLRGK